MLSLATAALLLAGCGDKFSRENFTQDGYTTIRFQGRSTRSLNLSELFSTGEFPGEAEPLAIPTNGMIIFAINIGNQYLHRLYVAPPAVSVMGTDGEFTVNWTLPNGSYHFYTVGYNQTAKISLPTGNLSGTPLCAIGTDLNSNIRVDLAGVATTIQLTPDTTNCTNSSLPFERGPFQTTRQLLFCTSLPTTSSVAETCTSSTSVGSVKFSIGADNFDPASTQPTRLESGCLPVSTGTVTMPRLPAGNPDLPSQMRIQSEVLAWNSSDCKGSVGGGPPDYVFVFPWGMANATSQTKWNYDTSNVKLFITP